MIKKITLDSVASYYASSVLETDKRVNLIYGLNGTGKSTMSNFLYNPKDPNYNKCSLEGVDGLDILVYNQKFIKDYFYEDDSLKGIFTIAKENKDAKQKIDAATKEIEKASSNKGGSENELEKLQEEIDLKLTRAQNKTWEIKGNYSGGDRVFEYCLDGLKGQKDKLFNHIFALSKPDSKPIKSIDDIKEEIQTLSGDNGVKLEVIPSLDFTENENNELFLKEIIGNENSSVAGLIKKLGNSDWVKDGIKYLPKESILQPAECPFCQEKTITDNVIKGIQEYFNETYENDINELKLILDSYENAMSGLPTKESLSSHPIFAKNKNEVEKKYDDLHKVLKSNQVLIKGKIETPSKSIKLKNSSDSLKSLNDFLSSENAKIKEHNSKIENKTTALADLKKEFWTLMRWEYDQTIDSIAKEEASFKKKSKELISSIDGLTKKIQGFNDVITEQQKNTVNVQEAIESINKGLIDIGIAEFSIKKHSDDLYKIIRGESDTEVFQSLSEGEKMIISFLYFIELCRGKKDVAGVNKKKVVVIDDPISSLSHIFVFNIGRLIHQEFLRTNSYEQIFILTHSLYFFYELTHTNKEKRTEEQKLFRLRKNNDGSQIIEMKYEEIQNDYHSYWHVIKDDQQPPALIANCMRNIIEYFFNFIEKQSLNNVFQKNELQDNKYQAFCRYMNRESHSLGQNIFDIKEFDYDDFKEAFKLVFEVSNYQAHYKRMMK